MKAVLVEKYGGPGELEFKDHQLPDPGDHQVLIEVKYAGVNFPDILITQGKYQFQPDLPFSPGGEVSGTIKAVGSKVTSFKIGDRVVSGTGWGGFAEEVLGFDSNTHKIPDHVSVRDAAATLMTFGTVIHALKDRAALKPKETLCILGAAGGVGVAAIQLGKWMGAKVIACASSDEKLKFCKTLGADSTLLYAPGSVKEQLKEMTEGKGVDVIFDPVGGPYADQAFRAIAPMGRYLVVGFASGEVPAVSWNLPLLKSASIVGVFWGNFFRKYPNENKENIQLLMNLLSKGIIKPQIDKIYPLRQANKALTYVEDRRVKGKVLLEVAQEV